MQSLYNENPAIPALTALNMDAPTVSTQFGNMPLGSAVSCQLPLIPPDFNVHCSWDLIVNPTFTFSLYPMFPFVNTENVICSYIDSLLLKKRDFIQRLMVSVEDVHKIEEGTRLQASEPEWFKMRKFRITASLNNQIHNVKTEKGLKTLATNIASKPRVVNDFLKNKLDFGRYHEPIALHHYEKYMKARNHHIQVENIGLVIDHDNFIFGATPDAKVVDISEPFPYGIVEIKCSEEYKNNDPYDICYISKTSCLEIRDGLLKLKETHSYYDQVQMQLGVTSQSWCDFVLYTKKGLVIDRVRYNPDHWLPLREKLTEFYFNFLLDEFISVDSHLS